MKNCIGEMLHEEAEKLDMTIYNFCKYLNEKTGVKKDTLFHWATQGKTPLINEDVLKVAQELGMTLERLNFGTGLSDSEKDELLKKYEGVIKRQETKLNEYEKRELEGQQRLFESEENQAC